MICCASCEDWRAVGFAGVCVNRVMSRSYANATDPACPVYQPKPTVKEKPATGGQIPALWVPLDASAETCFDRLVDEIITDAGREISIPRVMIPTVKEKPMPEEPKPLSAAMPEAIKLLLPRNKSLALYFIAKATKPDKPPADADSPEALDAWFAGLGKPTPTEWPGVAGAGGNSRPAPNRSSYGTGLRELIERGEADMIDCQHWTNAGGLEARVDGDALEVDVRVRYRTTRYYSANNYYSGIETVRIPLDQIAESTPDMIDNEIIDQVGRLDINDLEHDFEDDYELDRESDYEYDEVAGDSWCGDGLLTEIEDAAGEALDQLEGENDN